MNSMVHQGFHRPASIVNDFFHYSADVAVAFGKVKGSESCGSLVVVGMGLKLVVRRYIVEYDREGKNNQKNTK